ncbi:MAG: sigma-70 family RNA polymerase sigma factor [Planctomycetes bacterium]|nr:sigma-70 family RNA polymerase sigma factor [Planctomycetota bacterium]
MPRKPRHTIYGEKPRVVVVATRRKRSSEELRRIDLALNESIVVVESPLIKKRNAEKAIFEKPNSVPRTSVAWYSPGQDLVSDTKNPCGRVLTREEEVTLFRQYNYARWRVTKMQERLQKANPQTDTDIDELLRWFNIAMDRRDHIVECNLPLVLAMAKRSYAAGEYSDLVAEGNVALVRCVDRFNCELGFKFSTYACRALTAAFNRYGKKQLKHKNTAHFEIDADREMQQSDVTVDSSDDDRIHAIRLALRSGDVMLTDTEHEVMRFRYGLHCPQNPPFLTLQQVGKELGISKERVRQIQLRAIAKIRDVVERHLPADLLSE